MRTEIKIVTKIKKLPGRNASVLNLNLFLNFNPVE